MMNPKSIIYMGLFLLAGIAAAVAVFFLYEPIFGRTLPRELADGFVFVLIGLAALGFNIGKKRP